MKMSHKEDSDQNNVPADPLTKAKSVEEGEDEGRLPALLNFGG